MTTKLPHGLNRLLVSRPVVDMPGKPSVQTAPRASTSPDPRSEYLRRLQRKQNRKKELERLSLRLSNGRLALVLVGFVLLWATVVGGWLSAVWFLPLLLLFVGLVVVHGLVKRAERRKARECRYYEWGLARVEDRWMGMGNQDTSFLEEKHPFAADLDLFGKGSLFELLCTARTRSGERTLAGWLLEPARPWEIRERQEAVEELRSCLDLREEIALLGEDLRSATDPDRLVAWAGEPPILESTAARLVASLLVALTAAGLVGWALFDGSPLFFLVPLLGEAVFAFVYRRRVLRVIARVGEPEQELELLSLVLERLERERFRSSRLRRLLEDLKASDRPPSRYIARLARLVDLLNARHNQMFVLLSYPLLWGTQLALAIEAWRRSQGPAVARWLETVGEFEALSALAGYAFEHPEDPMPEIVEETVLEGVDLRHPLLPRRTCVPNSIRLDSELRLMVVSGSNMSGKSTLLRTVGVNTVLALAGSPVSASRMRLCPLSVGATLRIQDSLQEGTSRFYAEITRIRRIVELTEGPRPVLFLLDEILHGTNSHDRSIGAEAVIRGLLRRNAMGLVTTHDLALARLAERLAPVAANFHFEDHLEDGRMVFDYRLRPGVVEKSNALELMRSLGLEV